MTWAAAGPGGGTVSVSWGGGGGEVGGGGGGGGGAEISGQLARGRPLHQSLPLIFFFCFKLKSWAAASSRPLVFFFQVEEFITPSGAAPAWGRTFV